nr:immunoglobulin light chain junction region [Macaca mulatta]MOW30921.1 immunoglobulin light chain junction region [Macaca mulatta]
DYYCYSSDSSGDHWVF